MLKVFPRVDEVPENLLRIHLQFREPPDVVAFNGAVQLLGCDRSPIRDAFVHFAEGGLWEPEGRVVSLLLHPGRLKSGLAMGRRLGSILQAGCEHAVRLDLATLFETTGPAPSVFEHRFRVGPAWRDPLPMGTVGGDLPTVGSTRPLRVRFSRALDAGSAAGAFTLLNPSGAHTPIRPTFAALDRTICLKPKTRWSAGTYRLLIDQSLEDLAGNRMDEPFQRETRHAPAAEGQLIEFRCL
jgi:hypothetical protein